MLTLKRGAVWSEGVQGHGRASAVWNGGQSATPSGNVGKQPLEGVFGAVGK